MLLRQLQRLLPDARETRTGVIASALETDERAH